MNNEIKPIPKKQWEHCPMSGCGDNGGYPVHASDCNGSCVNCPVEEQCEFCWSNPKSVFNQLRLAKQLVQQKIRGQNDTSQSN